MAARSFGRSFALLVALAACEPAKSKLDDPAGDPDAIDCGRVADAIRAAYTDAQKATFQSQPKMARWFETTQRIVRESCEQDRWPESVKQCAVAARPGDPQALATCNQAMPADLQQKMQDRMVAAMKSLE